MTHKLTLPLNKEDIKNLRVGDNVLLSGTMYTARDSAHKRLFDMIQNNEPLPFDINGQTIYYVGPAPAKDNAIIGPCGPTSSYRMDAFTPALLDMGLVAMIGKGERSTQVVDSIVKNGCVYLVAIGGAAALISKSVTKDEPICFEDLGTESVHRYTVQDFPCIVAIDSLGNNIYKR